jgi:methyl acetate hydrolase
VSTSDVLESAVAAGHVPGVVALAVRGNGAEIAGGVAGVRSVESSSPMERDSVFRLYSMTKAVGSTAAAMLIEEGSLTADTPVVDVLPEFAQVQVCDGFDGETPILRPPTTACTVRHLATHTSGLTYGIWNRTQAKLDEQGARSVLTGKRSALLESPMVFDPGTAWAYGFGTDWLGQVVEAVSGTTIDVFLAERLFEPLGMVDAVFERDGREDRLVGVHKYDADGSLVEMRDIGPPPHPEFYGMGHALIGTADDYLRFLRMFLNGGELDGVRVLAPETVAWMFANQIGDLDVTPLVAGEHPLAAPVFRPAWGAPAKHGFAFVVNTDDVDGRRRAGSQTWAGLMNTHMWVDPTADVAGVVLTQVLPFGDSRVLSVCDAFEREVYAAR